MNPVDKYEMSASVYKSKNSDNNPDAPLIVYYHGGGWIFGSPGSHHHAVATMASETGATIVSVAYRLAPQNTWRIQLSDYRASFEWVTKHRDQLGVSAKAKLGVAGDSAGGHISAILAHEYKSSIDFQILVYPVTDLCVEKYASFEEFSPACYLLPADVMLAMLDLYLDGKPETANDATISPMLKSDFSGQPKCLIVGAELDPLVDQVKAYYEKLAQSEGNCAQFKLVRGVIHGFFSSGFAVKQGFGEALDCIKEFVTKL